MSASSRTFYIPLVDVRGRVYPWVEATQEAAEAALCAQRLPGRKFIFKATLREGRLFMERVKRRTNGREQ